MKKILCILLLLLPFAFHVYCSADNEKVYKETSVSIMPYATEQGGAHVRKQIQSFMNLYKREANAKENAIVHCEIMIEKDGSVFEVTNSTKEKDLLDNEAFRIIRTMPKWVPAQVKGTPVACQISVYFNFYNPDKTIEKMVFSSPAQKNKVLYANFKKLSARNFYSTILYKNENTGKVVYRNDKPVCIIFVMYCSSYSTNELKFFEEKIVPKYKNDMNFYVMDIEDSEYGQENKEMVKNLFGVTRFPYTYFSDGIKDGDLKYGSKIDGWGRNWTQEKICNIIDPIISGHNR